MIEHPEPVTAPEQSTRSPSDPQTQARSPKSLWISLITGAIVALLVTSFITVVAVLIGLVAYGRVGLFGALNLTPYIAVLALAGVWGRVVRDWWAGRRRSS